jgi:Reverse transcriptase (RNA-dependent DNA polymerase)
VLTTKLDDKGEKLKACFVVQGCRQVPGEDYLETFSPTLGKESQRILLSIIGMRNMQVSQLNVASALLHGNIDRDIFIE